MLSTIPALLNDVFVRFLLIIFILLYYFGFTDRNQFIITFFFIYVIQFILILFYVLKKDKPSLKIDFNHFRKYQSEILKFGFFMSFVAFASLGIKMIDTLVLAKYSLNFVGIYTIASFIPNVIEIPALALERITGSVVSNNLKDSNYKEVSRIYKLSVLYLLIISGLLFLGILTNIKFLLNFLPSDYAGGLNVVYIIGFGALFNAMAGASTPIIFNSNSYIKGGLVLLSLVVINLILNITLIPPYGMNGAALATGISAIIYTFMRWYLVWKEYRIHPFNGKVFALFCLIIILFLGSFLLPQLKSDIGNIILRSSLIILVYGTFIWTFNIAPELKELVQTKLKANT